MSKLPSASWSNQSLAMREAMRLAWNECLDTLPSVTGGTVGRGLSAERLFEALDGRTVSARGRQWLIEIYSVRQESDATWLQLALQGESSHSLLMRLAPDDRPKHAVRVISAWLGNRPDRAHILNVA